MNTPPGTSLGRRPFWCPRGPARRTIRWCRRCGYVIAVLALYGAVHLNQVGLPGFVKEPLLQRLRDRGLELEFGRMRVRLGRGIVAENVNVGRARVVAGEQVYADQLQLRLDWWRVLRLEPEIAAITVRGGKLVIPLVTSNGPAGHFDVEDVEGRLNFTGAETWELERLHGRCLGGEFRASGTVTNAGLLRRRSAPREAGPGVWHRVLLRAVEEAGHTVFSRPPSLSLHFAADLRDPLRSGASAHLSASGGVTAHGEFEELSIRADLNPVAPTNGLLTAELRVESGQVTTRSGSLARLALTAVARQSPTNPLPESIEWRLAAEGPETPFARASSLSLTMQSCRTNRPPAFAVSWSTTTVGDTPPRRDAVPFRSVAEVSARGISTPEGVAVPDLHLHVDGDHSHTTWSRTAVSATAAGIATPWANVGGLATAFEAVVAPLTADDPADGPWKWARPFSIAGTLEATNAVHPQLVVDRVALGWDWHSGNLSVTPLRVDALGGSLAGKALLDVAGRRVTAEADATLEFRGLKPLLSESGRRWLGQYSWRTGAPPRVTGTLGVRLPAWTNRAPDWRGEALSSLTIDGAVTGTNFAFRGVPGDRAEGAFNYTNRVWRVPGITATRPEGRFVLSYEGDEVSKFYRFGFQSDIDPKALSPLVTSPRALRIVDDFRLGGPPRVVGELRGRWKLPELTAFEADIDARDVVFRGEHLDHVAGRVAYTNRFVAVADARLQDGSQQAHVPGFAYDAAARLISFTNATSTFAPDRITRLIGPKTHHMMSAYQFAEPPSVRIDGVMGLHGDPAGNDIRFDTESAGEFRWWKLRARGVSASVRSVGPLLVISNLTADFHDGRLEGDLEFDTRPGNPATFRMDATVRDADLRSLMADLSTGTNRLEGRLSGKARITEGDTSRPETWKGSGEFRLLDGHLWDFPMLGALSKVMDGLSSGLGRTRFTEGSTTFTLADGRIATRDLSMHSPSMRLDFVGSVGLDRSADLIVQGTMFREVPILGPIATIALSPFEKLFEYRITGTLDRPEAEPAHIPSLLLFPFRPLGTLRDLLSSSTNNTSTPSPPKP